MSEKIAVLGLGYVGLPLAVALAKEFESVVGFDISEPKVRSINLGVDPNSEGLDAELKSTRLRASADPKILNGMSFYIVGVPTPVDSYNRPDLGPLRSACELVGKSLTPGAVVVFESTVYPGLTEEICGPLLEKASGLTQGKDFKLGYSPERMNPGDREHGLANVVKVVAGEDEETLARVAAVYSAVVKAGVHKAPSIKVAEAAKVIENTQRDINIALMNELSMLFDRMNISTKDVLDAASTKWNFLRFTPGLVGGHCIGVDPYYLTTKAEELGYHPQVILAGRRINDGMGSFVAQRLIKSMVKTGVQMRGAKVGVLGITFKENVTDVRNSRVPSIIRELQDFGVNVVAHDPMVESDKVYEEYGLSLSPLSEFRNLDGLVFAVTHREYLRLGGAGMSEFLKSGGIFADIKSAVDRKTLPSSISYWSL